MFRDIPRILLMFLCYVIMSTDNKLLENVCHKDDLDCLHPNFDTTGKLVHGKCHMGNTLIRKLDVSLLECVEECLVTSKCTGINYRKNWKICDVINRSNGTLMDEHDCLYSDIDTWPKELAGHCSNNTCPEGTACKMNTNGHSECVNSYCKGFPETPNATCIEKFGLYRNVAKGNKFSCIDKFSTLGPPIAVCMKTGEWATLFCCTKNNKPADCGDLPRSCRSGVYKIYPTDSISFNVYCDMEEEGGGWTVFQRRFNGKTSFDRNWIEYKDGFGDITEEHWLGNKNMHLLTSPKDYILRVDLEDHKGSRAYAVYSSFHVADEKSGYLLNVSGYNGTAGDSLTRQTNMKFSTADVDNDHRVDLNCARIYKCGWWFNGNLFCYNDTSNLNAIYDENGNKAIRWKSWSGGYSRRYSIKSTRMMIRQK